MKAQCWRVGDGYDSIIGGWSHAIAGTFTSFKHGGWNWTAEMVYRDEHGVVVAGRWRHDGEEEPESTRVHVRFPEEPLLSELHAAAFKEWKKEQKRKSK